MEKENEKEQSGISKKTILLTITTIDDNKAREDNRENPQKQRMVLYID